MTTISGIIIAEARIFIDRIERLDINLESPDAFHAQLAKEHEISIGRLKQIWEKGVQEILPDAREFLTLIQVASNADDDFRFRLLISLASLCLSFYSGHEDLIPPESKALFNSPVHFFRVFLDLVNAFEEYAECIRGVDTPLLVTEEWEAQFNSWLWKNRG